MRNRHIRTVSTVLAAAAIGAGLGLTACASAATPPASTPASTPTKSAAVAAAPGPGYVALNCDFKPVVRPATYVWTCADYGSGITDMHWTSWTSHLASGYGTYWENDCTPDCAAGKDIDYPILATFWGSAAAKGYPADLRYTELTLIFPGKRPPYYAGTRNPLTETVGTN